MQDARSLLDSLMGPSRDRPAEEQRSDAWKDKEVCKRYLVGFCPNQVADNWFHNTRRDVGMCYKTHSDRLREDFEAHADRNKFQPEFEREFLKYLEGVTTESDLWVKREQANCAGPGKKLQLNDAQKAGLKTMQEQSEEALVRAEKLGDEGDVAGSRQASDESTRLKEDIVDIKERNTVVTAAEEVCCVCGVRGNPDGINSFSAHMNGNLHKAMLKIREKAQELREKVRSEQPDPEKRGRSRDNKDREKGKEREKDRKDEDRKDVRDKDREKDRKGSDDKKGDRDRDRGRSDRDRGDRDRDRDRRGGGGGGGGRDKERSRSRDRRRK